MSHHHDHSHNSPRITSLNSAFIIGITLNLLFVVVESGAGLWFNSMALLSDAGHNLTDVISLMVAMLAFHLAKIKGNKKFTYGYRKSTILASLLNAVILLIAVGAILIGSIKKVSNPPEVAGGVIAWVAGIGVLINGITALLFMKDKKKDLNVKGAYLHMLADAFVSIGVLLSGLIISYTGFYIIDPIIGVVVAVVILISTWSLLRDSIRLSLDGVPVDVDLKKVKQLIAQTQGVKCVCHVHVWAISTTETALTAHIIIDDYSLIDGIKKVTKEKLNKIGIGHATLEFEHNKEDCMAECDSFTPY